MAEARSRFIDHANDEPVAVALYQLAFCCPGVFREFGMGLSFHSGAEDGRLGLCVRSALAGKAGQCPGQGLRKG